MKGRGAARAPAGPEGEGGLRTPDLRPGACRPLSAAPSLPPESCLAATGTQLCVSTVLQGPGAGLAPLVPASSGMRASLGRGTRAWALSSSPRAAPETAVWSGGWTVAGPSFRPRPRPGRAARVAMGSGSVSSGSLAAGTCFGVVWGFQGEGWLDPVIPSPASLRRSDSQAACRLVSPRRARFLVLCVA